MLLLNRVWLSHWPVLFQATPTQAFEQSLVGGNEATKGLISPGPPWEGNTKNRSSPLSMLLLQEDKTHLVSMETEEAVKSTWLPWRNAHRVCKVLLVLIARFPF